MIKRKYIIYLIICLITLMQIYLYLKEDKEVIEVISSNKIEAKKSFEDIDKELNEITNYKIDGNANEFQVLLDICR